MNKKYFILIMVLFVACFWFGFNSNFKNKNKPVLINETIPIENQHLKNKIEVINYTKNIERFIGKDSNGRVHFLLEDRCNESSIDIKNNSFFHCISKNDIFEGVFSKSNNYILSEKIYNGSEDLDKFYLKKIDLNSNKVISKKNIIDNTTVEIFPTHNKVVLTDMYYGQGGTISILDKNFRLEKKIKIGFENIKFSYNNKSIYALFYNKDKSNYTIIDIIKNEVLYDFSSEFEHLDFKVDDDNIYIFSLKELKIININSKKLIKKLVLNNIADFNRIFLDDSELFIPLRDKSIFVYDIIGNKNKIYKSKFHSYPFFFKKVRGKLLIGYFTGSKNNDLYNILIKENTNLSEIIFEFSNVSGKSISDIPIILNNTIYDKLIIVNRNQILIIK